MAVDRTVEWSCERAVIAVCKADTAITALGATILHPYEDQGDADPPLVFAGTLTSQAPDDMEGSTFRDVQMAIVMETSMDADDDGTGLHDLIAAVRAALTLTAISAAMAEFADISLHGIAYGATEIDHDGDAHRREARMEATIQCQSV